MPAGDLCARCVPRGHAACMTEDPHDCADMQEWEAHWEALTPAERAVELRAMHDYAEYHREHPEER